MMTELGIDAGLPQRILHVLTVNQHREGLTIAEIKKELGLDPTYNRKVNPKIYKAIGVLMNRGLIKRWTSPVNRTLGVYALASPSNVEPQESLPEQPVVTEVVEEKSPSVAVDFLPQQLNPLAEISSGWNIIPSSNFFPPSSGLYIFFSGVTGECLYVGRAANLEERCRYHEMWKQAVRNQENPYAAYKVIDYEQFDKAKQELVRWESFLIGILQPKWNTALPLLRENVADNDCNFGQTKLIHWTQFFSKQPQPFHPSMLTDEGYVVLKTVESIMESSEPQKRLVRVKYDKDYAKDWANDLANQVDIFFSIWEPRRQRHEPTEQVKAEDTKDGSDTCIELVINDSVKVKISVSKK